MSRTLLLCLLCVYTVYADIYLQNPRGSNNRFNDGRRDRRNANRMFDSQNNARGGYNVGRLYYLAGSKLPIKWSNQHSCGNANSNCEIIIQYMCADTVRDGTSEATIPDQNSRCQNFDCNTDGRFGMNEDFYYYQNCVLRHRNKGLFTADQNMRRREKATNTRQNPRGTRRGYECQEERDYYPYWRPSPWKDIAVLTNNVERCPYYQAESENQKGRYECVIPRDILKKLDRSYIIPTTEYGCKRFRYPKHDCEGQKAEWKRVPSHNLAAPVCMKPPYSRDNHLGYTVGGDMNTFNWTVPQLEEKACVLRIRYNISTADYNAWNGVNASNNGNTPNKIPELARQHGLTTEQAGQRGYIFKNDPVVNIFPGVDFSLRLALNTAQFGRTFQDRSHAFEIRKSNFPQGKTVHNVNVQGKRGNIVQTFPATEYAFLPNDLRMNVGDIVHFQWTGSDKNPVNNDGQGRRGTDRSNIVLLAPKIYAEGSKFPFNQNLATYGHLGRNLIGPLHNYTVLGLPGADLLKLALHNGMYMWNNNGFLDDSGTYFDLGPREIRKEGVYNYMSTRNNNFSNRSHKGRIVVDSRGRKRGLEKSHDPETRKSAMQAKETDDLKMVSENSLNIPKPSYTDDQMEEFDKSLESVLEENTV